MTNREEYAHSRKCMWNQWRVRKFSPNKMLNVVLNFQQHGTRDIDFTLRVFHKRPPYKHVPPFYRGDAVDIIRRLI